MSEANTEQPYVFIPEPPKSPEKPPDGPIVVARKRPAAWPWLLLGIPLGIIGTIVWQKSGEQSPKFHSLQWPPAASATATQTASPLATFEPSPTGIPTPGATATPSTPDTTGTPGFFASLTSFPAVLDAATAPNPVATTGGPPPGSVPMPATIPGNMPTLPNVGPSNGAPPGPTNPVQPGPDVIPDVALVSMSEQCGEVDMDALQAKLAKIASKLGGTSRPYAELAEKKESDRNVMLVLVPLDKRETATSQLRDAGVTVNDNWQGNPQERSILLQERLDLALHNLQQERAKLLVKYYEDAGPVKEMDERIEFAKKQIGAVKLPKDSKMAVFRIYIGPNA